MSIALEAVKPGDFVATQRMGRIVKSTVDRVTKTQIIVGDQRFDKRFGKQIGLHQLSVEQLKMICALLIDMRSQESPEKV